MKRIAIFLALIFSMFSMSVDAATIIHKRNPKQRYAFVKKHPCPATVPHSKTSCPGYVVDHVIALCVGGKDRPSNMQWQTYAASKAKDAYECKKPKLLK